MPHQNPIKRIFDLYTSDLSYQEIENLIKREASEVYEFFKSDIPKPDQSKNKLIRGLIFIRSLFNAFIMKLTPARRIFYLISIFFFGIGYLEYNTLYIWSGFIILNLLLAFELADKLLAKNELDIAKKIQLDLIPKHKATIGVYEVTSYYEPAREVGGDYFDIIEAHDKTYIVIGDISGKGMAAALYMTRVQAIIYFLLDNYSDVKEILIKLKKYFSQKLRKEFFLTITIASIEKDGTINLVRAGHPPPIHYDFLKKEFKEINTCGIGIGFNDYGVFEKTLELYTFTPGEGDTIVFHTDGLTETMNKYKIMLGEKRIKKAIERNSDRSAEEIKKSLVSLINNHRAEAAQNDDVTFIVLKRISSPSK
ncbi:PP2C family protein-serine/threonine phosphatase [Melioribacter sp. OK-6-Me]|uniref:PP2C family protein-serine/threonine phosphatase n=1 Tax=unclassified Melioribacter TaxID=2627329 RepID=UPI003ED8ADB1